jgi:protein O-GlcNAc transferase
VANPLLLTRPDSTLAGLARSARNNRLSVSAQQDYGLALLTAGQVDEAMPYLEQASRLELGNADHHINLSAACHRMMDWPRAYWHAAEAHRLAPVNPLATNNMAALHLFWGEIEHGVEWYQKTLELDPSNWVIWTNWLFALDFLPLTPEDALRARGVFNTVHQQPLKAHWPRHRNNPDPERKLRIVFTGGDFRAHSASYMFGTVYEHLDRDRFEIVTYADLTTQDQVTDWFKSASNGWRNVTGWTEELIARAVQRDEIDVLIDLGSFTDKAHLYVHMLKPAPLSISAWGHLTGTGVDCMDGLLVDRVMLPEDRAWEVTETPCYVPFALGFTAPKDHVEIEPKPEGTPLTFGYLGRIQKLSDPTIALWADLLHATPGSRLILKDGTFRQERTRLRMHERFEAWGIDPARIELRLESSRPEHMAVYNELDVSLDPITQSGGATTLESLWMGTPSVAMNDANGRMVSRISASTLTAAGHPEWAARDAAEYVELAQRIGAEGGHGLRDEFLASAACDNVGRTRGFEDAVRGLWRSWCSKQKERAA